MACRQEDVKFVEYVPPQAITMLEQQGDKNLTQSRRIVPLARYGFEQQGSTGIQTWHKKVDCSSRTVAKIAMRDTRGKATTRNDSTTTQPRHPFQQHIYKGRDGNYLQRQQKTLTDYLRQQKKPLTELEDSSRSPILPPTLEEEKKRTCTPSRRFENRFFPSRRFEKEVDKTKPTPIRARRTSWPLVKEMNDTNIESHSRAVTG